MKINNTTQIKGDDFPDEDRDLAERIGNILNPFMQQVVEINDGRLDFENRVETILSIEMTVDADGKPLLNDKVNIKKSNIRGIQVISALNLTNPSIYAESQPFVSYSYLGNNLIKVNKITGLGANYKFQLTMIIY